LFFLSYPLRRDRIGRGLPAYHHRQNLSSVPGRRTQPVLDTFCSCIPSCVGTPFLLLYLRLFLCHNRVPVLWPSQFHAETTATFAPRHCYLGSNTHPGCRRAHNQCKFHHRSFGLLYALVLPCAGRERRRVLPCFLPAKLSRTTQSVLHSPVCFTLSCSRSTSQDLNDRRNVFQDTSSSSSSPRKIKLTHHPLWQPL
jgi:hypothetical protein